MFHENKKCVICPRGCQTDKAVSPGFCGLSASLNIASICLHNGEEPPVSGSRGICNIFFPGCNLNCIYCQNYQISRGNHIYDIFDYDKAAENIIETAKSGSGSIGFVSPSHRADQMKILAEKIKKISPEMVLVMNTNSYDHADTIRSLDGLIDVYLPDFKYSDPRLSAEYSGAVDYPSIALKALIEMKRQKGTNLVYQQDGDIVRSGMIIRHLILPGAVENSINCLRIIAEDISVSVHVSLMSQYNPSPEVYNHPQLGRKITQHEYDLVLEEFHSLGFSNGWTQDPDSSEYYNPDFSYSHPFEAAGA